MTESKAHRAVPKSLFARLVSAEGEGGSAGLFVAHSSGVSPRDPVAHPRLKLRPAGAAQPLYLCDEPTHGAEGRGSISKSEVDIAAFVEVVAATFPQPRDPDVRAVLKARPKEAGRPFLYLPGLPEEGAGQAGCDEMQQPVWNAEAIQRAHKERELKAFHEFLDRMESAPLESLDSPLADLDERAEVSRQFAAPLAPSDPILEGVRAGREFVDREATRVLEEDRALIVEAVIEPLDPVAKPRFPHNAGAVLSGGAPPRLSPSQRAHLKRPETLRDRNGKIAPVTYSVKPRTDA